MNWKTIITSTGLALAVGIGFASCDKASDAAPSSTHTATGPVEVPAAKAEAPELDGDRLLARASARWDAITHDDWIQAHDFVNPDQKRIEKLSGYLQGKDDHKYRNPSRPRLVAIEDDRGYVDIEVMWTPLHSMIYSASNIPPEGMTQALRVVETWVYTEGEWYWVATERRNEFYQAHAELAQKQAAKEAGTAQDAR